MIFVKLLSTIHPLKGEGMFAEKMNTVLLFFAILVVVLTALGLFIANHGLPSKNKKLITCYEHAGNGVVATIAILGNEAGIDPGGEIVKILQKRIDDFWLSVENLEAHSQSNDFVDYLRITNDFFIKLLDAQNVLLEATKNARDELRSF